MDRNRAILVVGGSVALLASGLALRGFLKKVAEAEAYTADLVEATEIADEIEQVVKPKRKRTKATPAKNGKTHIPA